MFTECGLIFCYKTYLVNKKVTGVEFWFTYKYYFYSSSTKRINELLPHHKRSVKYQSNYSAVKNIVKLVLISFLIIFFRNIYKRNVNISWTYRNENSGKFNETKACSSGNCE